MRRKRYPEEVIESILVSFVRIIPLMFVAV